MKPRGFTLVELVITLAIAAIILAFAAPSMRDWVIRYTIQSASNDLSVDLMQTRTEATRRGIRVLICASSNGSTCNGTSWANGWLVAADSDNDGAPDAGVPIINTHAALSSGYTLSASPAALTVSFSPAGYPDATRDLTLCKSGYAGRVLSINAAGRIAGAATTATCS